MRRRLRSIACWGCLLSAALTLAAWPLSCARGDGITLYGDPKPKAIGPPPGPGADPIARARYAMRADMQNMAEVGNEAYARASHGAGRLVFVYQGNLAKWRATTPSVNHDSTRKVLGGGRPTVGSGDPLWRFGGFAFTSGRSRSGTQPRLAVAVPHWFVTLALLAWPAWRLRRRWRAGTAGFEVMAAGPRNGDPPADAPPAPPPSSHSSVSAPSASRRFSAPAE